MRLFNKNSGEIHVGSKQPPNAPPPPKSQPYPPSPPMPIAPKKEQYLLGSAKVRDMLYVNVKDLLRYLDAQDSWESVQGVAKCLRQWALNTLQPDLPGELERANLSEKEAIQNENVEAS